MVESTRVCLMCGGKPLTSSHIIGEGLQKLLPSTKDTTQFDERLATGQTVSRAFRSNPLDQQVQQLCWPCNGEWMEAIESRSRQSVAQLANAEQARFDLATRHDIAAWVLVASMLRATQDSGPYTFTKAERERFRETSSPDGWNLAVFAVPRPSSSMWWNHIHAPLPSGELRPVIIFRLFHVAFMLFHDEVAPPVLDTSLDVLGDVDVQLIWPPNELFPETVWPVGRFDDEILLSLRAALRGDS